MRRFRILILAAAACVAVLAVASNASAGDFAEGPCSGEPAKLCPTATVGQSYSSTFTLKEPGDCGPTFAVSSGSLPARALPRERRGCRARHADSGRELQLLHHRLVHAAGCKSASDQQYTINVNGGTPPKPKLTVTTPSLPDANLNVAYTAPALQAVG